jgi:hypothetical protein
MAFSSIEDICVLNGKRTSYDTHEKNVDLLFLSLIDTRIRCPPSLTTQHTTSSHSP